MKLKFFIIAVVLISSGILITKLYIDKKPSENETNDIAEKTGIFTRQTEDKYDPANVRHFNIFEEDNPEEETERTTEGIPTKRLVVKPENETSANSVPYPLKRKEEYPLIDEIKNQEIFYLWKNCCKDHSESEYHDYSVDWIKTEMKYTHEQLINGAYKDLKNTEGIEYMDYDTQDALFKDYLKKRYDHYIETYWPD